MTQGERPHFKFWPKGVARDLVVPQATLPEYLDTAARRYPGTPAIVSAAICRCCSVRSSRGTCIYRSEVDVIH